jgi:hypothetical protein
MKKKIKKKSKLYYLPIISENFPYFLDFYIKYNVKYIILIKLEVDTGEYYVIFNRI